VTRSIVVEVITLAGLLESTSSPNLELRSTTTL
jgi:hypothetical protein